MNIEVNKIQILSVMAFIIDKHNKQGMDLYERINLFTRASFKMRCNKKSYTYVWART